MRTWALLLGVAALAVAATVDAVRGGTSEAAPSRSDAANEREPREEALRGPDSPPPGSLPGRLVVATGEDCRLRVIDLAGPVLGAEGPPTDCGLWLSPDGTRVAVSAPYEPGTPAPFARISLLRVDDPPQHVRDLGLADGEVSWSPDGTRVALCGTRGRTSVLDLEEARDTEIEGCAPRFTPGGSLLTSPTQVFGDALLRDGSVELDASALLRGFDAQAGGELDVLAYDEAPDGLLAVSAVRLEPLGSRAVLELWRDGELLAAVELPRRFGVGSRRLGEFVRFSPNGAVLALGPSAVRDSLIFVDLRLRRPSLELDYQRSFAWSPDGQWLAVALDDEIAVYSANSSEVVYRLPLEVQALAWAAAGAASGEDSGEGG